MSKIYNVLDYNYIKESAIDVGFDLVGITQPREFEVNRIAFEEWIESGRADNLPYMSRYMDARFNPAALLDNTRSVVVCALNYKNQFSCSQSMSDRPKIASYALARDYHKVIRKMLKALLLKLQAAHPSLRGRCCVDTAPLLEKQLALEAGLGWIGRQSLLITPQFGSFVLLGVLLIDDVASLYDSATQGVGCAECRRCIENCPSGAIGDKRTVDSRKCISALTVECDNPQGEELHGWIFGCDECQNCCPYNHHTPLATNPSIQPLFTPLAKEKWCSMTPEEFAEQLGATPLKRGGLERLQGNCEILF
ncbi:MAG: tRNA epoxyqueuosine(34) reductase QueG [Rikenellaceae bacterium]